jgi:hypothetical protein
MVLETGDFVHCVVGASAKQASKRPAYGGRVAAGTGEGAGGQFNLFRARHRLDDGEGGGDGEGEEVVFGDDKDGVTQALLLERINGWV